MKQFRPVVPIVSSVLVLTLSSVSTARDGGSCAHENSHQFDFWIGDWEVYAEGELAGFNSIQPILDGCVLLESWSGSKGSQGSSFNFFNPTTGQWQQFWVWKNGTTLELSGSYSENKMVLEGISKSKNGEDILNRITWYKNEDGTVRQYWETSTDRGKKWKTAFDGLYRKKN